MGHSIPIESRSPAAADGRNYLSEIVVVQCSYSLIREQDKTLEDWFSDNSFRPFFGQNAKSDEVLYESSDCRLNGS